MNKYFGMFDDRTDVARKFQMVEDRWKEPMVIHASFPTEDQILFASYDTPSYEGDAFVLLKIDGVLYEVHGSHCSCYGLEDQWDPEETTIEALRMRPRDETLLYCHDQDARDAYWAVIDSM